MLDIGRACVKTAGRDAGKTVVIVDVLDRNFVLIDGQVKRRRCNIEHLEPLTLTLPIKKNAPHDEVVREFKKVNITIVERKSKAAKERPKPQRSIKKEPKETPKK